MRKKEGFLDQRAYIIPQSILVEHRSDPVASVLHLTDIGYYPKAGFHYRRRRQGCAQHILLYCVGGRGWVKFDDRRFNMHTGHYVFLPKGQSHAYGADNADPWSIYWVHFDGTQSDFFVNKSIQVRAVGDQVAPAFGHSGLFDEIFQGLSMGFSRENLAYANICLWHILGSFKYQLQFAGRKDLLYKDSIDRSIHYMKEHLREDFDLRALATESGFSVSHFCNVFKKRTSRTPLVYFMQLRIQEACRWLDFTELKVLDVAEKVGFQDPYYFSRIFSKVMGLPPTEYRRRVRG
jgi:AraC-like DNA-binding protein